MRWGVLIEVISLIGGEVSKLMACPKRLLIRNVNEGGQNNNEP